MTRSNKNFVGLFGGSFDPPHDGHLKISKICIKKLNLQSLYWIVAKKNPFKKNSFFSLKEKIEKFKKMTKKIKKIHIKNFEKLVKSTRTIDTLKFLIKNKKNVKFFLIIGSDNLVNFHRWKSWKKIAIITQLVVFPRKNYEKKARKSVAVNQLGIDKILFIKNKKINISSSQIRKNYLV